MATRGTPGTGSGLRATATALALGAVLLVPASGAAQTPYRAACDLLPDETISTQLGTRVTAQRDGSRTQCVFQDRRGDNVMLISLLPDSTLQTFEGQGGKRASIGGLEGLTFQGNVGRVVLALPEGGLLDVGVALIGERPRRQLRLANTVVDAILAAGPVSAVPADRGAVERLYVEGEMCDALPLEQLNAITGASFTAENVTAEGRTCFYTLPDQEGSINFGLRSETVDSRTIDAGTYDSEEIMVADRPATWRAGPSILTVDAGDGQLLVLEAGLLESLGTEAGARRDQAVQLTEALMGGLTNVAPPPPPAPEGCPLAIEEVVELTGLEIDGATAGDDACSYGSTTDPSANLVVAEFGVKDPATFLRANNFPGRINRLPKVDVAGQPGVFLEVGGSVGVILDLDGSPGGDGKVLIISLSGLASDADARAISTSVAEAVLSRR